MDTMKKYFRANLLQPLDLELTPGENFGLVLADKRNDKVA